MNWLRRTPLIVLMLCVMLGTLSQAAEKTATTAANQEKFELKVKSVPGGEIVVEVGVDVPFGRTMKLPNRGTFAISGLLLPETTEGFPLALSTFQWHSETDNALQSCKPILKVGKSTTWGVVNGPLVTFTVTLSRLQK